MSTEAPGYPGSEMAVIISLLRAVNVGGRNQIKMEKLRALYASLGLRDAKSFVQSGNVIFRTEARDLVRMSQRIERAIEESFGFRPAVILRTTAELRDVIARNPFAGRRDIDPSKLLVTFLASEPGAEAQAKTLKIKADPEELRLESRELYIYFANGIARSKLSTALLEKTLGVPGTGRNWNTVRKLLEMAEMLEEKKETR
jgi:uncharacterized protein (DUF1697 family)